MINSNDQLILIVEDEARLAQLLRDYLQQAGFGCEWIADGTQVLETVQSIKPALILLDLMLPGCDGLTVCRTLRAASTIPIIIVTARTDEIDRLLGLELGADDYICKPFSPREVVARVKAILRRLNTHPAQTQQHPIVLDHAAHRVFADQRHCELTAVEFALLATLFQSPGRIFSRSELMDRIYNDQRVVSDRTVDSHIKKLRRKLAELLPDVELVHAVYGVGYRYEAPA